MLQHIITKDGSSSFLNTELNEHYHSTHGAVQESTHVYIEAGLSYFAEKHSQKLISILEIGFGTGLNALLSIQFAEKYNLKINYDSIEAFPLSSENYLKLNYSSIIDLKNGEKLFKKLHECDWDMPIEINDSFQLIKLGTSLECFVPYKKYDVIYFDAFAPNVQPELWTRGIFEKMFALLNENGILVTYCAKGEVKRNMKAAGFTVEGLPGPIGKREMTRGTSIAREEGDSSLEKSGSE